MYISVALSSTVCWCQKSLKHLPNNSDLVPSVMSWTGIKPSHSCSGPAIIIADPLLDVVQFGLQIFTPALLHPIIRSL